MKRISLQPSVLTVTLERVPADDEGPDYIDLTVTRDEQRILSKEISRGSLLSHRHIELTASELNQLNAALVAEWLDWKPTITADDIPTETILDVFARLKKSLEDKGLVAGGEAAE